jgi:hypothetical protein
VSEVASEATSATSATSDDLLDVLSVDLDHLTVGEIEEIEERTGQPIDDIQELGTSRAKKGKLLRALAYVMRKRSDPGFTWEDSANLRIKITEGDAVPPSAAAG